MVVAGIASGAALLTKPEFGLACAGTGLVILTGLALFPRGLAVNRGSAMRALGFYTISMAVVAGIGYGLLSFLAGWEDVWQGLSGYDQDAILIHVEHICNRGWWPIRFKSLRRQIILSGATIGIHCRTG